MANINLKLGKLPPKIDNRTIKLSSILKALPPIPDEYDNDKVLGIEDNRMFANNIYGDCVVAGAVHEIMRFEKFEQGQDLQITDEEVVAEYMKVTNNEANGPGMVMLDFLNHWRQEGIVIGGKTYKIHAFASVNWKNHQEVKAAIYLLRGIYTGFFLPISAQRQFDAGKLWELVDGPEGVPGSWGGHCMYSQAYQNLNPLPQTWTWWENIFPCLRKGIGYNGLGPFVMTWGKKHQMTWPFWNACCEESYIVIDERDEWLDPETSPLKVEEMESILKEIT